ncbi:MAG: hypothetical protein ACK5MT_08550 [Actinomycetales bacterium]
MWLAIFVLVLLVQMYGIYRPSGGGPMLFPYADKVFHAGSFAAVGYAAVRAFVRPGPDPRPGRRALAWVVGLLVAHAVLSELIQAWLLPARSGDPLDALADLLGVALGVGVASLMPGAGSRGSADAPTAR